MEGENRIADSQFAAGGCNVSRQSYSLPPARSSLRVGLSLATPKEFIGPNTRIPQPRPDWTAAKWKEVLETELNQNITYTVERDDDGTDNEIVITGRF